MLIIPECSWGQSGYMRRMSAIWERLSAHPYCTSEQSYTRAVSHLCPLGKIAHSRFRAQLNPESRRPFAQRRRLCLMRRYTSSSGISLCVLSADRSALVHPRNGDWCLVDLVDYLGTHKMITRSIRDGQDSPAGSENAKDALLRRIPRDGYTTDCTFQDGALPMRGTVQ